MRQVPFYAWEQDVGSGKNHVRLMQGYHRQINGVSVYAARYAGVWRVYDEDSGRWMVEEKAMKVAIKTAESYIAYWDARGAFTTAQHKDCCRDFLKLRKEATNGLL